MVLDVYILLRLQSIFLLISGSRKLSFCLDVGLISPFGSTFQIYTYHYALSLEILAKIFFDIIQLNIFSFFHFLKIILLIVYLFTSQMLCPFSVSPLDHLYTILPSPMFPYSPTCSQNQPLLLPCPGILLYRGIKPSHDQGPLFSLISYKAILC